MKNPFPECMRLDRLLSQASGSSRSQVKKWLKAGLVEVNAVPVSDASRTVNSNDIILLEGAELEWPRPHYVMLHKPAGYECSAKAGLYPLVNELIDRPWSCKLNSAGRLDADTTGLVLLTDDGQWNHRVTSPRSACIKKYLVTLSDTLSEEDVTAFNTGFMLDGESRATLPATLQALDEHTARVLISEGRYHQIKRMFAARNNHVESLHREAIGNLELDPSLEPGCWRELTLEEKEGVA